MHGLRHVGGLQPIAALQIGDGAGDLQQPVVGPGGEAHSFESVLKQPAGVVRQRAEFPQLAGGNPGVAGYAGAGEAPPLYQAGGVDAALNNYVAIHYESRHMSWLHAMWGIGALTGPYIMGFALGAGQGWSWGYRYISILQVVLTAILIFSLPLWKKRSEVKTGEVSGESDGTANDETRKPLGVRGVLAIRGAKEILVMFFCYSALESTAMLWGSSYMVLGKGIDKTTAAMWASLFCIGITVGRLASGFLTMKFNDPTMIRLGQALVLTGIVSMLLPLPHNIGTIVGLMIIGLGCAPIYPCVIHSTPAYFGEDKSQAIVGMQMACAYVGSMCMPPVFGLIAQHISVLWFPLYMLVFLVLMVIMHESLRKKCGGQTIGW